MHSIDENAIENETLTRQYVDKSIFVLVVWQTGTGKLGRMNLHVRQFLHHDTITHKL